MKRAGNKSRYAWFAVLVFWMALIFHFSNQRAAESAEISGSFSYRIVSGVRNVLSADWEEETVEAAASRMAGTSAAESGAYDGIRRIGMDMSGQLYAVSSFAEETVCMGMAGCVLLCRNR